MQQLARACVDSRRTLLVGLGSCVEAVHPRPAVKDLVLLVMPGSPACQMAGRRLDSHRDSSSSSSSLAELQIVK